MLHADKPHLLPLLAVHAVPKARDTLRLLLLSLALLLVLAAVAGPVALSSSSCNSRAWHNKGWVHWLQCSNTGNAGREPGAYACCCCPFYVMPVNACEVLNMILLKFMKDIYVWLA